MLVYTILDNMFLAYTCIYKYMNYIQAYTTIHFYILRYTSMIILIQGAGIPDEVQVFPSAATMIAAATAAVNLNLRTVVSCVYRVQKWQ